MYTASFSLVQSGGLGTKYKITISAITDAKTKHPNLILILNTVIIVITSTIKRGISL